MEDEVVELGPSVTKLRNDNDFLREKMTNWRTTAEAIIYVSLN